MSYPEQFDTSNLDKFQLSVLADFYQRRKMFDIYLTENKIELHTCPNCGYPTLTERGGYEICCVCNWEDDNQDNKDSDEIWGGPNYELSLTQNRLNIGEQLAKIAEEIDGRINTEPSVVLTILSRQSKSISELFNAVHEDADLNHLAFKGYKEKGQELLKQLVTPYERTTLGLLQGRMDVGTMVILSLLCFIWSGAKSPGFGLLSCAFISLFSSGYGLTIFKCRHIAKPYR